MPFHARVAPHSGNAVRLRIANAASHILSWSRSGESAITPVYHGSCERWGTTDRRASAEAKDRGRLLNPSTFSAPIKGVLFRQTWGHTPAADGRCRTAAASLINANSRLHSRRLRNT